MSETLIIISVVCSIIALMLSLTNTLIMSFLYKQGERIIANQGKIIAYVDSIERYLAADRNQMGDEEEGFWRSEDGKYQARTIDDLMRQMLKGEGQHSEITPDEFIKDINSETPWVDEEINEEEDDEDEPF